MAKTIIRAADHWPWPYRMVQPDTEFVLTPEESAPGKQAKAWRDREVHVVTVRTAGHRFIIGRVWRAPSGVVRCSTTMPGSELGSGRAVEGDFAEAAVQLLQDQIIRGQMYAQDSGWAAGYNAVLRAAGMRPGEPGCNEGVIYG